MTSCTDKPVESALVEEAPHVEWAVKPSIPAQVFANFSHLAMGAKGYEALQRRLTGVPDRTPCAGQMYCSGRSFKMA